MMLSLLISFAFAAEPTPPSPAPEPAPPINKELSTKELTVGNVTLGKSNLYNPVGYFGTNMFKKQGADSGLCYKGDDGTILAFVSSADGGRDQIITDARLIAAGQSYEFEKDCKPSKKVSKTLALDGVKLGDAFHDVVTAKGEPTQPGEDANIWQYRAEAKKKTISTNLELVVTEDKITGILLHHLEKR